MLQGCEYVCAEVYSLRWVCQSKLVGFVAFSVIALVGLFIGFVASLVYICCKRFPRQPILSDTVVDLDDLVKNCSSGDIILFSYPLKLTGMFSGHFIDILETLALKLQGRVQWTHVGIVVREPGGQVYLAESTTDEAVSGHLGPGLCCLRKRLELSAKEYDLVCWRKLAWSKNITQSTRLSREKATIKWIRGLSKLPLGVGARYKLDLFRAAGKILFDHGYLTAGLLFLKSGSPNEYDCCMFAAKVLSSLGILLKKGDEWGRIYTVPHFSVDRVTKSYYIRTVEHMDWSSQIKIDL
eukprot:CAMPEP_0203766736 /NCGR_PEP_ID=MMETSP0099_2-20121227/590_1 /ASSEMBLY_ACC=CAM_ASM_000209 /TAXON_ID=96639 /ORGANISM=" , Strain NY0313808BC1" /LENGTH=295 /DNA_ID=CAMNT_0050663133 /DNA_START=192 /DNA_END=1079 /DNA_ORIENTATION=+